MISVHLFKLKFFTTNSTLMSLLLVSSQSIPTVIEGNEDEVETGLEDEGAQDDDSDSGGGDEFSNESDYDEDDFEDADE